MKHRPILFSAPMVRAILAGTKTQTRRVCKLKSFASAPALNLWPPCPHGDPGDRLWVRETWRDDFLPHENPDRDGTHVGYLYRADPDEKDSKRYPWRPSIFMPRAACRLVLEITAVRIERVQDISGKDLIAEGFPHADIATAIGKAFSSRGAETIYLDPADAALDWYMDLWEHLNAKRGFPWKSNPYVWVISFRRVDGKA